MSAERRITAIPCRYHAVRDETCGVWELTGSGIVSEGRMYRDLAVMLAAAPPLFAAAARLEGWAAKYMKLDPGGINYPGFQQIMAEISAALQDAEVQR